MKDYIHTPLTPFDIEPRLTAARLLARMGGTSFQARNLARGLQVWQDMLRGQTTIFLGVAGALVPAGMRPVLAYLIQNRLIDCLVSTGANLFHDLHETLGYHYWQGSPFMNDEQLARSHLHRIYDTLASAHEFNEVDAFIARFSSGLDASRGYTTQEYLYLLGKFVAPEAKAEGIITSAAKAQVPIYCPALGDSGFGLALADLRAKGGKPLLFDLAKDVLEMASIAARARATGAIYLGGGTPKNFIQHAAISTPYVGGKITGHRYALQITTDLPQWGGSSGATFEESRSWGKVAARARTVTVNCDATIALPLLVSALAENPPARRRRKPSFLLGEELIIRAP